MTTKTEAADRIEGALAELGADLQPPAGWEGRVEATAALERLQHDLDFLQENTVAAPESWANVRLELARIGAALRAAGAILVLVVALVGCAGDQGALSAQEGCTGMAEAFCAGWDACSPHADDEWMPACVAQHTGWCLDRHGDAPIEPEELDACLAALDAQRCTSYGLPPECVLGDHL